MKASEQDYELAHLRSEFDSLTDSELYEYLSPRNKGELQRDFVADWIDADDREEAVFALVDYSDTYGDLALRLEKSWHRFLEMRIKSDARGWLLEEAWWNYREVMS